MALLPSAVFLTKNGSSLTLRSLGADDASELLKFREKISKETINTYNYPGMPLPTLKETADRLNTQALDCFAVSMGAFHGDQQVGYLQIFKFKPDHPWYAHVADFGMMILEVFWGQGLGRKLLELLEQHCLAHQITRIEATVRAGNDRGVQLYLKAGFKIEGTLAQLAKIDNQYFDVHTIAKLLSH
jgi:RimJ/RimL family protein N-acetyltransferase